MAGPGMLFVTMQPKPGLSLDQFHEWYNNEHGPTRLRLPDVFSTGQRYHATDSVEPAFLATYDVKDMSFLTQPVYTDLRAHRSPREAETIGQVDVKRYLFDLKSSRQSPDFVPFEDLSDEEADGIVLVYVDVTITDAEGAEDALGHWYEEEHFPMLTKVPGWLRTRRYRTSSLDGGPLRIITLHEYKKVNGLGGPEHVASMSTSWREEVFSKYVANKGRRTYSMFYVFGSAPRDLSHLSKLPTSKAFVSADAKTATTPDSSSTIRSYAVAPDGLEIPYILEGNASANAPTIAFSNSLLTSLHMWDEFVTILKKNRPEFRILRYDQRGRHAIPSPPVPATVEMLADDLHALLKSLRIPQLHALVGVSLGGATTFQFALKYPDQVAKFVACDFNIASSEANTSAWKERIGIARSTAEDGTPGMQTLAGITVSRWFHPFTLSEKKEATQAMTSIVAANSQEGFEYGCQALWTFDLRPEAKDCRVPGLFVVGEGDGKGALAKSMEGFRKSVGSGNIDLKIIPQAGHLPMYENPQSFWENVEYFL